MTDNGMLGLSVDAPFEALPERGLQLLEADEPTVRLQKQVVMSAVHGSLPGAVA